MGVASLLVIAAAFDPTYYSTVAHVLPVFLVAAIFELKLLQPDPDEPADVAAWLLGFFALLFVAELSALFALADQKKPTRVERAVIVIALYYGMAVVVLLPIMTRWERLKESLPWGLGRVAAAVGSVTVAVVALLVNFNVVGEWIIGGGAAAVVMALLIGTRLVSMGRELRGSSRQRKGDDDDDDDDDDAEDEGAENDDDEDDSDER